MPKPSKIMLLCIQPQAENSVHGVSSGKKSYNAGSDTQAIQGNSKPERIDKPSSVSTTPTTKRGDIHIF